MEPESRLNNSISYNTNLNKSLNNLNINNNNYNNNYLIENLIANVFKNPLLLQNLTDSILINMNNRGVKLNKSNNLNNEEMQQNNIKNKNLKRTRKRGALWETNEKDEDLYMWILFQKKKIQIVIINGKKTNK